MVCALLTLPLQRDIGEKVELSPLCSEVKALLADHTVLARCKHKTVEQLGSLVQKEF